MKPVLLGTAQWGLDYGITNTSGPINDQGLASIESAATRWGIDFLDTSPLYGNAETRISQLRQRFRIQTKYVAGDAGLGGASRSLLSSSRTCGALPDRLLVHDWSALTAEVQGQAAHELETLRSESAVNAVGVSVYTESDIESALIAFDHIDVIQLPASILDQRLSSSPFLHAARAEGTLIQARSIFLQGVLTSQASPFRDHRDVARIRRSAAEQNSSMLAMALGYICNAAWIDEVTFGVVSASQLDECMTILGEGCSLDDLSRFASMDTGLIDPRFW